MSTISTQVDPAARTRNVGRHRSVRATSTQWTGGKTLRFTRWGAAATIALVLIAPLAARLPVNGFYMTVKGVSMTPTYRVGDVLLVIDTKAAAVQVGDIVIARFPGSTGHSSLYVHRVVQQGNETWRLKGDFNREIDPVPVHADQIVGKPVFALRGGLGEAFTFTQSIYGRLFLGGVMMLLLRPPRRRRSHRSTSVP